MNRRGWKGNLIVLLVSTLLCLSAVEFLLRWIAPGPIFQCDFPLYPHRRRVMVIQRDGQRETVVHSTNRWGLRGDEPPADWTHANTLITVGGSTTQCYYLDDAKTWPARLQDRLRAKDPSIWVGNAGLDGHTTRGHLQLMKQVVGPLKPKTVLFLVGVNDLALSLRDSPRSYDLRGDWRWRIFNRTRIGQILYTWSLIALKRVPPATHATDPYELQPLTTSLKLPADLQTFLPGLREYRDNVHKLIQLSRDAGIRPIFLTQPMLFEDTPRWRRLEGSFSWVAHTQDHLSAADYWKLMKTYNDALMDVCRKERVDCFDLAAVIPHSPIYFGDAVHFSAQGCDKVAEEVARFLERRNP